MPTVLIPGGAKGIGRHLAVRLAERGWSVAIAYRTSEAAASATRRAVEAKGSAALSIRADVSYPTQCEELVKQVVAWKGGVDALIQCAGPYHRRDLLEETPEGWREMFANNLDCLFYLSRLVAPGMIQRKSGRIIAFSIVNADRVIAQPKIMSHYLAKVGVLGLVRTLAKSLGAHGITVNAISPGFLDTGSGAATDFESSIKNIPAGRLGTLDEVADAVLYLLSNEAAYVNGTNLILSGGWGL
jgi:3-oxoacyl-[acyl-carrier protein] reductase